MVESRRLATCLCFWLDLRCLHRVTCSRLRRFYVQVSTRRSLQPMSGGSTKTECPSLLCFSRCIVPKTQSRYAGGRRGDTTVPAAPAHGADCQRDRSPHSSLVDDRLTREPQPPRKPAHKPSAGSGLQIARGVSRETIAACGLQFRRHSCTSC